MENNKNPKTSTTSKAKKKFNSFSLVKKIIVTIWVLFFAGVLGIFGIFWATSNGWLGEIPNVRDLENPDIYVSSEILSSDGVLLDRFEAERRTPVDYKDLPPHLVDALLAKEDVRYFEHSGVDIKAAFRAISS